MVACIALCGCAREPAGAAKPPAAPGNYPGFSGLAHYRDEMFVAVHDTKRDQPEQPRLALIALSADAEIAYRMLDVDWSPADGLPHDLEAIAPLPGAGRFLVVESGRGDRRGRAIRLRLEGDSFASVRAEVDGAVELPEVTSIEGAAVIPRDDQSSWLEDGTAAHATPTVARVDVTTVGSEKVTSTFVVGSTPHNISIQQTLK